jgi:carboxylesterase
MLESIVVGAAIVALLWGQRTVRASRAERRFRRRFPARADGIVIGAETRSFEGNENRAILLLHGYNDSPYSLDAIARALHGAGWTVHVPLLPGHGRSLEAFASWTSEEMLTAVRAEYAELRARHRTVVVGGLSMGGALACWLGAEADPDGVVLYAPMLFVPRTMQVAVSTARLWSLLTRYLSGRRGGSILDPDAQERMISYGSSSRASLEQLERISTQVLPRLGFVHAPVLVLQSEEDNRLPHDQSVHAIARIGSSDKTVVWTRGAGHVITVDHGWPELAQTTIDWLDARFPASAALPPTVPVE